MVNLLRKTFIKDYENINNKDVRLAHGILASIVGLITNLIVFLSKLIVGIISFSISIISDAINNLSDMATSLVALFGFKMSKKAPDEDHPFGHERMEYISGLIVSLIIIIVGGALLVSSIIKMVNYENESFSSKLFIANVVILSISIVIKLYQAYFYHKISKIISSISLKANFKDSLNDVLTTSLILIALIVEYVLGINNRIIPFSLDGLLGIIVSSFIVYTGISLLKEESNPLLGTKLKKEYIDQVVDEIKKYEMVLNYHDIMCHTYGENKCYMTIHLEVDKDNSLEAVHEVADQIEYNVRKKYGIELTTHFDPIDVNDEELKDIKAKLDEYLTNNHKDISIHDLRIIRREKKSLVLFDMIVPYGFDNSKIIEEIKNLFDNKYSFSIDFENPYY